MSISETYPGLWPQIFTEYEVGIEINGYAICFHPREEVRYPVRVFCIRFGVKTLGLDGTA